MSSLPPPPPSGSSGFTTDGPTSTTCFHHRDRETGRTCTRCGRPACWECLREAAVGSQCFECVKASVPPVREQVRRWNARQHFLMSGILIALNVAVFLAGLVRSSKQGFSGTEWNQNDFGLYGPSIHFDHEWYRIITSGFLHASFFHILMNMAALAQLGRLLEVGLGRVRFAVVYFVSLIAGSAGALIVTPDSLTVGASGAIFGLLGALAIAFHRRGISIWQTGIGGILVINLLVTFAVPGISIGGHLGGLVGGGLAGFALMQTDAKGRPSKVGVPVALIVGVAAFAIALVAAGQG